MSDEPSSARGLGQPLLGLAALASVLAVSFAIFAVFSADTLNGWVAFLAMTIIPTQIVCALVWHCEQPEALTGLPQPLKGIAYLLLSAAVGAVVAFLSFRIVGAGIAPPTPPLIMFIIFSIVVTFWFVVIWGTWPVSLLKLPPTLSGLAGVALCYLVAYALFRLLFDFSFLEGAPFYSDAIDPHGMFVAWQPLVFGVTTVSVITFSVLCEFWPVRLLASPGTASFRMLASAYVLLLAAAVFYIGTGILGLDIVRFLVVAPVPFIFGFFIVLGLLGKFPFGGMAQPAGGLLTAILAAAAGCAMYWLYFAAVPLLTGEDLAAGPPAYQLELWLASAMLAVTFPLITVMADFLGFWPFLRSKRNG